MTHLYIDEDGPNPILLLAGHYEVHFPNGYKQEYVVAEGSTHHVYWSHVELKPEETEHDYAPERRSNPVDQ